MASPDCWKFEWKNFRGYERGTTIEFPSLTLLIGRNNVGKTSLYSPLLLLRQTLAAKNPDTALLFRGTSADFGSYEDIVTDHDTSKPIEFHLNFGGSRNYLPEDLNPESIRVQFKSPDRIHAAISKHAILGVDGRALVERTREKDDTFKFSSYMLPSNTSVGRPLKEVSELRRELQNERPKGFLFSGTGGLFIPRSWRDDPERWRKVRNWYSAASDLFDVHTAINQNVTSHLANIAYVGPLRSHPKRTYLISPEPPTEVDSDGSAAYEMLYNSENESDSNVLDETNQWLRKLGYGKLSFESTNGRYFNVLLSVPESELITNIADCGMGLSQLLPILVQGLLLEDKGALVVQQPEIHLNPAQQDVMTDFLIAMCQQGKRIIVETHSEHILTRLRRRIAEGDMISNDSVAIYFVEGVRTRSKIRRIPLGNLGQLERQDWPAGFFGENLENAFQMSVAQSRRSTLERSAI